MLYNKRLLQARAGCLRRDQLELMNSGTPQQCGESAGAVLVGEIFKGISKQRKEKKIRFVCEGLFIRKQNKKEKYGGHTAGYVKQLSRIICLHYSNFILFVPFLESVVPFHPFLLLLLSFWLHLSYIKDGCSQHDISLVFLWFTISKRWV